jgi:hypothetical protein
MSTGLFSVSVFGYSEAVPKTPNPPAGSFARKIADTILDLAIRSGGSKDGRWLADRTTRGKDYWNRGFNYAYAFTVNDVAEVATLFDATPYQVTLWARDGIPVSVGRSNVSSIGKGAGETWQSEQHAIEVLGAVAKTEPIEIEPDEVTP